MKSIGCTLFATIALGLSFQALGKEDAQPIESALKFNYDREMEYPFNFLTGLLYNPLATDVFYSVFSPGELVNGDERDPEIKS
jgi:hypothetical protein